MGLVFAFPAFSFQSTAQLTCDNHASGYHSLAFRAGYTFSNVSGVTPQGIQLVLFNVLLKVKVRLGQYAGKDTISCAERLS